MTASVTAREIDEFLAENPLDPSQQLAFKNVMASPVTSIQGPPGTGKTWVARQVMNFLVSRHRKDQNKKKEPLRILIMAYKNLSLDHLCGQCLPRDWCSLVTGAAASCLPFLPNGRLDVVRLGRNARSDALTSQDEARDMYSEFQVLSDSCC